MRHDGCGVVLQRDARGRLDIRESREIDGEVVVGAERGCGEVGCDCYLE